MPKEKQQELLYKITRHKFIIDVLLLIMKQKKCQKRELVEFLTKFYEIHPSSGYRYLIQMEKAALLKVQYHSDLGLYYQVPLSVKRYLLKILRVHGQIQKKITKNVITQIFRGNYVSYAKTTIQAPFTNSPKIILEPLLD